MVWELHGVGIGFMEELYEISTILWDLEGTLEFRNCSGI